MTNYQHVLTGQSVNVLLSIAAFRSLHVAFVTLVTLWMRGRWRLLFVVIGSHLPRLRHHRLALPDRLAGGRGSGSHFLPGDRNTAAPKNVNSCECFH
jgi:hypothetical protein